MKGFRDGIETLALDVTSDEDVQNVVDHIVKVEGRIDIVVNNAGSMEIGPLIDQALDHVKETFDTNTFSILRVAKAVIPVMSSRKSGLIVNIGSVMGELPTPWNGLYCSTKAALYALSQVLSMECRPFNISVLHVSPGAIKSNISKNQAAKFSLPESSMYTVYLPDIIRRMHASQGPDSMPTDVFAEKVVSKALRKNPPPFGYMTLGGKSLLISILKWLPRGWVLSRLWKMFSKKA